MRESEYDLNLCQLHCLFITDCNVFRLFPTSNELESWFGLDLDCAKSSGDIDKDTAVPDDAAAGVLNENMSMDKVGVSVGG